MRIRRSPTGAWLTILGARITFPEKEKYMRKNWHCIMSGIMCNTHACYVDYIVSEFTHICMLYYVEYNT